MELKDCKKDWRRRLAALERAKIAERTGRGGGGGAKASDVNAQDVLDVQDDSLAIARRMANTTQATVDSGMATLAALGDQTEQLNAIGDRVGELRGETQRGQDLERRESQAKRELNVMARECNAHRVLARTRASLRSFPRAWEQATARFGSLAPFQRTKTRFDKRNCRRRVVSHPVAGEATDEAEACLTLSILCTR